MDRDAQGRAPPLNVGGIAEYLKELHVRIAQLTEGSVATYIPELAKTRPELFGIAVAMVDGQIYTAGDADHAFTIQSTSKPFAYGYALQEYGRDVVMKHVGVEPTGEAFNSIVLDDAQNRPFNPMVNAGAIAVAELIRGATADEREQTMLALFSRFAGRRLGLDEAVYLSEKATGHRNRAIAYMMLNAGMIQGEPEDALDIYFRQCSLLATTRDLAVMSATLANDGVNPVTGERAIESEYVTDVLTVMSTCGMYNYAGHWLYEVGVPAKSGVSGSIMAVIPGQAGIAIFSPPIDANGNSVRGVAACKQMAADFGLHTFKHHPNAGSVIRRELTGEMVRSKRARSVGQRHELDLTGSAISVIEVQGALFFASTERLLRRAAQLAAEAEFTVFDLRRVHACDPAAAGLLDQFCRAMAESGKSMMFAHLSRNGVLSGLHARLSDVPAAVRTFDDRDAALEWCEDCLLQRTAHRSEVRYALGALALFSGFTPQEILEIERLARPLEFATGATIIREGDEAHLFFVLTKGAASVHISVDDAKHKIRLATVGPGESFGEMALLDGGRRSADVVADEKVLCYGFSVTELQQLGETHPSVMTKLLTNLARDLSERLRRSNNEVRALEN